MAQQQQQWFNSKKKTVCCPFLPIMLQCCYRCCCCCWGHRVKVRKRLHYTCNAEAFVVHCNGSKSYAGTQIILRFFSPLFCFCLLTTLLISNTFFYFQNSSQFDDTQTLVEYLELNLPKDVLNKAILSNKGDTWPHPTKPDSDSISVDDYYYNSVTGTPKPPNLLLNDIFISVKTTKNYHDNRLALIIKTWFQLAKDQVSWRTCSALNPFHCCSCCEKVFVSFNFYYYCLLCTQVCTFAFWSID